MVCKKCLFSRNYQHAGPTTCTDGDPESSTQASSKHNQGNSRKLGHLEHDWSSSNSYASTLLTGWGYFSHLTWANLDMFQRDCRNCPYLVIALRYSVAETGLVHALSLVPAVRSIVNSTMVKKLKLRPGL